MAFPQHADGLLPSLVGCDGVWLYPPAGLSVHPRVPYLKMLAADVAAGVPLAQAQVRLPDAAAGLANGNGQRFVRELLAFYFAHLIATVGEFIRTGSPWQDFNLAGESPDDDLVFQLAVPTGLLAAGGAAEKLFRESFILGHHLSAKVDANLRAPIAHQAWSEQVTEAHTVLDHQLDGYYKWQCLIYPEVAAAVQAFFRAPEAPDGLYLTMDVGAGTVDLNAFCRHTGSVEPGLNYYAAAVERRGIHNLNDPHDAVVRMLETQLMQNLRNAVWSLYHRAIIRQPNHGHQDGHRTWDHAKCFIFGGGARHPGYRYNFREGLWNAGIFHPAISYLPAAQDLHIPGGTDYGRFAVAYGMAFFKPNLDQVRLPDELQPFNDLYPPDPADQPPPYGFNWED